MSKFTQIDVRLIAIYGQGGLRAVLPNLFKILDYYNYDLVIRKEPSQYELVEVLIRIKNDPRVPQNSKRPIAETIDEFVKLRDQARELLLSRRLNELDTLLYKLEDLFADLDVRLA